VSVDDDDQGLTIGSTPRLNMKPKSKFQYEKIPKHKGMQDLLEDHDRWIIMIEDKDSNELLNRMGIRSG
jgi:hypothetical protein